MMVNRSKNFERENKEIFKAAQHEEMKSEINKLKEEVEKLNDQLIIVESERGEAEEQEDAGTLIWKQFHWQRWQYFAKVK